MSFFVGLLVRLLMRLIAVFLMIFSQDFFEVSERNSCGIACVISYEFLFCDVWSDLL